jgi:hypothetical protein
MSGVGAGLAPAQAGLAPAQAGKRKVCPYLLRRYGYSLHAVTNQLCGMSGMPVGMTGKGQRP